MTTYSTPILFLLFNRKDTAKLVFEEIKRIQPPRLYLASDGPRERKTGEANVVNEIRKMILDGVDWNCDVKCLFRDKNLGCKMAVSSAISWFFENEEMGIILEDDCLPNNSFFLFCDELLKRYYDDERVMHIGGVTTLNNDIITNKKEGYYFSKYTHIWGWATWKRAWNKYDVNISNYPEFKKEKYISSIIKNKLIRQLWLNNFESVFLQRTDTWDFQWYFTVWSQNGLAILPTVNLVTNIGFGVEATHTKEANHHLANMNRGDIEFLLHPTFILRNEKYDQYNEKVLFKMSHFSIVKVLIKGMLLVVRKKNDK